MRRMQRRIAAAAVIAVSTVVFPVAAQESVRSRTSLEEATAIAAQLLQRQRSPLAAALARVEQARVALHSVALSPGSPGFERLEGDYDIAVSRYADRLAELGTTPDRRTLGELSSAIRHSDDQVRMAAVTALREGAASDPSDPILGDVRALVTGDPSPEIRRQAFEAYCRWGNQDDVLSLSMAQGRVAGPLQDLAVREWLRIERERESAAEAALQAGLAGGDQP